ncbi:hypothetical protein FNJ84_14335 [Paracoccus sp. M683]|uniref:hypothetical protein n=1 Tax=Paracoccus sp. M683 TaxID=2594268 RepID=UPI00117EED11|nr:hypothetical protein [Paracoccus sp. M683]TRW96020.1 hypothetical protein FNJ84_14335 [Paracoccus sp. M683]
MSYQSTMTFAPGGASADTLPTGEIVAIPPLNFRLKSEDKAKALAHSFGNYTAENNCQKSSRP